MNEPVNTYKDYGQRQDTTQKITSPSTPAEAPLTPPPPPPQPVPIAVDLSNGDIWYSDHGPAPATWARLPRGQLIGRLVPDCAYYPTTNSEVVERYYSMGKKWVRIRGQVGLPSAMVDVADPAELAPHSDRIAVPATLPSPVAWVPRDLRPSAPTVAPTNWDPLGRHVHAAPRADPEVARREAERWSRVQQLVASRDEAARRLSRGPTARSESLALGRSLAVHGEAVREAELARDLAAHLSGERPEQADAEPEVAGRPELAPVVVHERQELALPGVPHRATAIDPAVMGEDAPGVPSIPPGIRAAPLAKPEPGAGLAAAVAAASASVGSPFGLQRGGAPKPSRAMR